MKRWILCWCTLLVLLAGQSAQAQSCTVMSASGASSMPYDPFSATNNDAQGSFSFSCTRPVGNPFFPPIFWIGVTGANGARTMNSGADLLNYALYTDYSACTIPWQLTTGVLVPNALTSNLDRTLPSITGTFCLRIPSGQNAAKPGSYFSSGLISIRSDNSAGFLWNVVQAPLALSTTVAAACQFSSSPTAMTINYTSFSAAAQAGSSSFQLRCTNSTPYTLALDAATGTLLGLTYTVGLSASSGIGSGVAQAYTVNGSVAAGQSGTCAGPGACTASQTRTLTVAY